LYGMVLYGMVWFGIVWYGIVLEQYPRAVGTVSQTETGLSISLLQYNP